MTTEAKTKSCLALALSKAQGVMEGAKKDANNPFFKSKYADLSSVWSACRTALSQNELAVIQVPEIRDGVLGVRTKLVHSSGEFEEGFFPIAAAISAKAQEMGSALTYVRRYALAAMVGVAPEDDDGESARTTQQEIEKQPDPEKTKLADEAKKYFDEIPLCDTSEKLEKVVSRYAMTMAKLSVSLPKWHARLVEILSEKRAAFEAPKDTKESV